MSITNDQYNELLLKIKSLEVELSKYKPEPEWYDTTDSLVLKVSDGSLELEANYSSWKYIKTELTSQYMDYLFLEAKCDDDTVVISLNLEQMEQIRDYLNQKIDYLKV